MLTRYVLISTPPPGLPPPPPPSLPYTTSFDGTENPLSESAVWTQGGTVGLDWQNTQKSGGNAFATGFSDGTGNDCISCLNLAGFTASQYAEGVLFIAGGYSPPVNHEVELHLRTTIAANSIITYEVLINILGGIQCVRWNGALSDFTPIAAQTGGGDLTLASGDVMRAEIGNTTIALYQNSIQRATWADSNIASGKPGIGFFARSGATLASFGWSSFTAGNL